MVIKDACFTTSVMVDFAYLVHVVRFTIFKKNIGDCLLVLSYAGKCVEQIINSLKIVLCIWLCLRISHFVSLFLMIVL